MNVRFIPNRIARNKLDAMRAILQSHYQVRIEEPDTFAIDRIRELEEENSKLKEELLDRKKKQQTLTIHEVVMGRADCPDLGFVNAKGNEYDGWLCAR